MPGVFTKFLQFFGCLAIVLYYDITLAFLALMSAPVLFFSSRFMTKMMRKYNLESRQMNGKVLSFSEESVQNLQTVKAFGLTTEYSGKFKEILKSYRNMRLAHDKFTILTTLLLSFIGLVVAYACYGWGVYRLWSGVITFGTMTLFLQLSGSLTSSFSGIVSMVPGVISVATAAGRIKEITELEKENTEDAADLPMKRIWHCVSVRCAADRLEYLIPKNREESFLRNMLTLKGQQRAEGCPAAEQNRRSQPHPEGRE